MANVIGYGATFKKDTPNALTKVRSISYSGAGNEVADVTHLASTSGYREFTDTLRNPGEITVEMIFDPSDTDQDHIWSDLGAGLSVDTYTITFSNSDTFAFTGILTSFEWDNPLDDVLTATATYQITGVPVLSDV